MLTKLVALWAKVLAKLEKLHWLPLLLVRITVGVVFIQSGWGKLHNLEKVIGFFTNLGIPAPEIQAPFVAGVEFVGGLAVLLGLGARFAAVPLMSTMVVAILTAKRDDFTGPDHDWTDLIGLQEFDYFVFFFVIAVLGAGAASLDALISRMLRARTPAPVAAQTPISTSSSPPT